MEIRRTGEEQLIVKESVIQLLRVAARSDELKAWFQVDPEMATIRETGIAPKELTEPSAPENEAKTEPDDVSFKIFVERLLAQLENEEE